MPNILVIMAFCLKGGGRSSTVHFEEIPDVMVFDSLYNYDGVLQADLSMILEIIEAVPCNPYQLCT